MTKFLVFGKGILGTALEKAFGERSLNGIVSPQERCDLTDWPAVRSLLDAEQPTVVVNAAAFTAVDACEDDREEAFRVNGIIPGRLAAECRRRSLLLVHVSTDFVFAGTEGRAYTEEDSPNPLSVYGQSKLLGELEVKREGGDWLTVRTSWHYGPGGRNFVSAIHDRAAQGLPLRVVSDQVGRPTYSDHLAAAILNLVEIEARGLVHYADATAGPISWFDFARAIVDRANLGDVSLEPIPSSDLDRPAARPAFSPLDTGRYETLTGASPPPWEEGLDRYLATLGHAPASESTSP